MNMKSHTAVYKSACKTRNIASIHSSAGETATVIAPPDYGIDFVDHGLVATAPVQRVGKINEELPMQSRPNSAAVVHGEQQPAGKSNHTGLPDNLKSGIEYLSGYTMDDVKVHYNSGKPSKLHAHAYAQGNEIHLSAGQEKHLPHEAWHVVQQKQGRVKPTMLMKGGVGVNDDVGLEKEADLMGGKALGGTRHIQSPQRLGLTQRSNNSMTEGVAQLFRAYYAWGSANTTPHVHVYNGGMHLKTAGGHRYNIIKNNRVHVQATEALANVQGKNNKKLRQTIKRTARDVFRIDLY